MWLHVWWLTLLLEFTLAAKPKKSGVRYFYGFKHVHVTEDTCAVIIGKELRKTETAFRREKVTAPCFEGPHAFGVVNQTDKGKNLLAFWICFVESGSTVVCWSNGGGPLGFVIKYISFPLTNCSMDSYDSLSIAIDAVVTLYSPTHICKCSRNTGCGTRIPMIGACPVKEIDQCTCNNRIMSHGGIMCRRSETGFFYLKDGTNMWEYVFWPRYDFFAEFDEELDSTIEIERFILLNHIVKDDICTISAGYAFDLIPFYYFDTVVMVDGKYEHVCLDLKAKFAAYILFDASSGVFGCFLSTNGWLQCGVFMSTYFVHTVNSHLDLSLCNYSKTDYFLSLGRYNDDDGYLPVRLCLEQHSNYSTQCCSYNVNTMLIQDLEVKKATFAGIFVDLADGVFHLNGTETFLYRCATGFVSDKLTECYDTTLFLADWDALLFESDLRGNYADRLYGIAYVKKRNYCLLEYRQPNHLIQEYSIPCMPETALKLFHLTSLDGYNFVEVCHYSSENHSIICYDHYTNAMSLYSLRGCTLYSKGDANYLFGYGTGIRIGDELSACTIERIDPGEFTLKTQSIVQGLNDPPLLQINDAVCADETTLTVKSLKFMNATGFDYVCETTMIKTDDCSYFYDKTTNEFHAISEGFDYTLFLTDMRQSIYIPDPERRCADYEPRLHSYHCYIILAIDVTLMALFLVVVIFEIKGFRLFMFEEVRQELIDKKMATFEANAHYYF